MRALAVIRALWKLARPKGMALIALLPIIGFSFAFWDHGCLLAWDEAIPRLALLGLLWAVPHMGTMWLNAALDRDEGQVLFGDAAPVPEGIEKYAYATIVLAVVVAFVAHVGLGACVLGCAILSVLYSHPRTAWKGHALLGPLANAVGYGVLSPLGGWLYAELPPTPRGLAVLCVSVAFICAAYLAAQAFQEEEDRARGYRTLVALRGARTTLTVTRALLIVSVVLTIGLAALGWFPRGVVLSAPAFFAADRVLVKWREVPGGGDGTWAARFFVRLAIAGLMCLAAVSIEFTWGQSQGLPLGGLGTESGHPTTRVCGG
ncbi:MAG: UbiA family prenyltransferase [Myxococcota bacterium]|nr:UbiA family prenyltransferase [Myxococcota bacterium]